MQFQVLVDTDVIYSTYSL